MNKKFRAIKSAVYVSVALFFACITFSVQPATTSLAKAMADNAADRSPSSEQLCFDALFPATPAKKVFDLSMCIIGDMQALSCQPMHEYHKALLHDVIIGRMVRLSFLLRALHEQHHDDEFKIRDYDYLLSTLFSVATAYKACMHQEKEVVS